MASVLGALLMTSAVVLVVGWSLLWLFASRQARSALGDWLVAERTESRLVVLPAPEDQRLSSLDRGQLRAAELHGSRRCHLQGECRRAPRGGPTLSPDERRIDLAGPLTLRDRGVVRRPDGELVEGATGL